MIRFYNDVSYSAGVFCRKHVRGLSMALVMALIDLTLGLDMKLWLELLLIALFAYTDTLEESN